MEETALIKINPQTDAQIQTIYAEAQKLKEYAEKRVILSEADLAPATDDLSIISKVKKALEEKRKEILKPFQDYVKEVNDAFKILAEPIEEADRINRSKILDYQKEQERRRQEQEEINRLRAEAAIKESELTGKPLESIPLTEVPPEAPKKVFTSMGSVGQRMIAKFEVVDFALLPNEYKMIDATKLGKVIRAGLRSIPGVKIWEEPTLAVNAK